MILPGSRAIILSCILAILLFSARAKAIKINLSVAEHPPYIEQQNPEQGFLTAFVIETFERVNISSSVSFKSWMEVENDVDKKNHLSFMWTKNKDKMRKWLFSDVIYRQKKQFLGDRKFAQNLEHLHDLRGISIGLLRGFNYGSKVENYRNRLIINEHVSDYANVKRVLSGQQQLAVIDPVVAAYLTNHFFTKAQRRQLKLIPSEHFESVSFYLVCAKRYGNCLKYIKKFNLGLALSDQDGTTAAVFRQAESLGSQND